MKKLNVLKIFLVALFLPVVALAQSTSSVISVNGPHRTLDAPSGGTVTISVAGQKLLYAKANFAKVGTVASGLTATGSTITDAYPITANHSVFTTVAAGTGALLPTCSPTMLFDLTVYNRGLNGLSTYPQSGGSVGGNATSAAMVIQPGRSATLKCGTTQDVWTTDYPNATLAEFQTMSTAVTTPVPGVALRAIVTAVPTAGTGRYMLPQCSPGLVFEVYNEVATGASVGVLPFTGSGIDAAGTDTAVTLAAGKSARYLCATATQYYTLKGA